MSRTLWTAELYQQDIVDDGDDHDGQLRQKAGRIQCHDLPQQLQSNRKLLRDMRKDRLLV